MSDSSRSPEEVAQGTPKDFLRPGERAILIEVAKLQATLNALEKANDRNISDFRWTWSGLALQLHSTLKCLLVATFRGRFRQLPLNILSRSTVQL